MEFDKVIKSISYNQHEILYNIMQLYNNGEPFECDMTYSKGKFYGSFNVKKHDGTSTNIVIPEPKYKFDVCPQTEDTVKIEPMGRLPLEDESLDSIVYDPPFIIAPKNCKSIKDNKETSNKIQRRFGSFYPLTELFETYYFHLKEFIRVLKKNGIAVIKTQDTISARKQICSPCYIWFLSECLGFNVIDRFVLTSKQRLISGKHKNQEHSRRFESYFWVIKKTNKNKPHYLSFADADIIKELMEGFITNNK